MNVCLICVACLSHHTLYMGNLVPAYTMYHVFPCWQKKREEITKNEKEKRKKKKAYHRTRFWSRLMTRHRRLFFGLSIYSYLNWKEIPPSSCLSDIAASSLTSETNHAHSSMNKKNQQMLRITNKWKIIKSVQNFTPKFSAMYFVTFCFLKLAILVFLLCCFCLVSVITNGFCKLRLWVTSGTYS